MTLNMINAQKGRKNQIKINSTFTKMLIDIVNDKECLKQ